MALIQTYLFIQIGPDNSCFKPCTLPRVLGNVLTCVPFPLMFRERYEPPKTVGYYTKRGLILQPWQLYRSLFRSSSAIVSVTEHILEDTRNF